ncbi:MAG: ABC transporter permease [Candidatus Acidiferrales bacterium]
MSRLLQDIRYALRMLAKSPGFTAIAVLTLALGIGANTSIFSVVYAALLRPLPYVQASRLITLGEVRSAQETYWDASYPDYLDWTKQSKVFESLAGYGGDGFVFRGTAGPQLLLGAQATTNFFSTLGVKPILGRDFAAGEDIASGPKVALLTYKFWKTQFGGDPRVIGRTMQLDANSVSIVGVLPRDFEFAPAGNAEVWVPLHISGDMATRRSLRWFRVIGRLAPGVSAQQARAEMNTITARLAAAYPQQDAAVQILMIPLRERIVGQVQALLWILFGAVGFVLLIACANVANLLLVRAADRRREFAIRVALGASRGRLASQMLTESLMLSLAGGALGFLAAQWGTQALVAAIPQQLLDSMPFLRDTQPNAAILAFLCGIAVLTGVFFGLAPAWQVSHERVSDALKEETRTAAGGVHTRLRDALVVVEIAFSLVLLAGAGLAVKSLNALLHRNPGFNTQNLLTFGVSLPDNSYPKDPDAIRFDREFTDRVRNAPGIHGIASNSVIPLSGGGNTIRFVIEGQPVATGHDDECDIRDVSGSYFSVMKIPLLTGRFFDPAADSASSPKHVIVNTAWVKVYLHGENPIGKRIRFTYSPTQPYREIVGVVGDIADEGLDSPEQPAVFCPFAQDTNSYINYIVRTAGNPVAALGQVREALGATDPQLFPILPQTMEEIIQQSPSVFLRRYPSYLIGSFAALALLLAMIGLYGLISYSVSQRTREIGIRVALGAQENDVMRLVLGQGVKLTLVGIAVGIGTALGLTRLMGSILYGVGATDPVTFAGVAILLAIVALAACYIPARRAMRTDPMVALRYE